MVGSKGHLPPVSLEKSSLIITPIMILLPASLFWDKTNIGQIQQKTKLIIPISY